MFLKRVIVFHKSMGTKPGNVSKSIVRRMWCIKLLLACLRGSGAEVKHSVNYC